MPSLPICSLLFPCLLFCYVPFCSVPFCSIPFPKYTVPILFCSIFPCLTFPSVLFPSFPLSSVLFPSHHGLQTPGEEIAFPARLKINAHPYIFRYCRSKFYLPHWPKLSDFFFDLCLHWVSLVRDLSYKYSFAHR